MQIQSTLNRGGRRVALAIFTLLIFLWMDRAYAQVSILTGPITNAANGHFYYLLAATNWTASEQQAVALGGHLATVRNAAEQNWIYTNFNFYGSIARDLWIGLYDPNLTNNSTNRVTRRTEFVWISGEPVTYSHWSPVEPNNPTSTEGATPPTWEPYVHIWERNDANWGTWNNFLNNTVIFGKPLNGVVEVVPVPSLSIFLTPQQQVLLSWPLSASNYRLEATTNLQGVASWQTVTNAPGTNGSFLVVTNDMQSGIRFYRLQYP